MPPTARPLLIVNPNTSTATTRMLVAAARAEVPPTIGQPDGSRTRIVGVNAVHGPSMIVESADLHAAAEHTVSATMAALADHDPFAVVVGGFGDPGVPELRRALTIPVLGIGATAIAHAAPLGRFAIVTTTPGLRADLESMTEKHCPHADFAGVVCTESAPDELADDPVRLLDELHTATDVAVDAGASVIVIGGGPLTDSARAMVTRTDVTVVEPLRVTVRRAFTAADTPDVFDTEAVPGRTR